MNKFAFYLLIAMGVNVMAVIIVIQIEPISALVKSEDPDAGGEIKAPSTGGALKPGIPTTTSEEKSKPQLAKKITPFPELKLVTPTIPSSGPAPSDTAPYKVKVTFDSVTVHNSHEGSLSGDGEYDLSAYVHGKLVSLTDMSRKTGASGLWDVSSGETVRFPPGSEVTVDIEKHLPLSILTVGSEIDECGRTSFPTNLQPQIVTLLTDNWVGQGIIKAVNTLNPLGGIQNQIDKAINYIGCKFNKNDDIGDIVKAYDAVGYGAGPHFDKSDKGDFSLAYTISVTPPAIP
jgi:hypothetical protein